MSLTRPKLRPGAPTRPRAGSNRRQLAALQRARLTASALAVVEEEGVARLTVAGILQRARVSRKTFYENFSDSEDCFLSAYEETLARPRRIASTAYAEQADWQAGMRAAIGALLQLIDQHRDLARICILDAPAAGERIRDRHLELIDELAAAIDIAREHADPRLGPMPLVPLALAGGILTVLQIHLCRHQDRPASELAPTIMSMIVLPYLGRAVALSEADSTPVSGAAVARQPRHPVDHRLLADVNIRLTYRTIRVLAAVREHPGASNQQLADASEITDAGQISKLLKRLAGLGLVENSGAGQAKGASNAWNLTPLGKRVQRTVRGS